MEKHLRKSQSLYSIGCIVFLLMIMLICIVALITQNVFFYNIILCLSFVIIIIHFRYVQHLKKSLLTLIDMCQMIIEEKAETIPLIDGESYIAVLSSHLHILNIRMQGMLECLHHEQNQLKNYIENISHQIKTPLTAMFLKEYLLLEITQGKQHQIVEQIVFQTQRIQDCIESLLHLAQLDSHSIEYHKKDYLFGEIIDSIQEQLYPFMEDNDVHLKIQGENQMIYCDFQWMKEAIENILKNCIEQKSHSSIDITCLEKSSYMKIMIHDHGDGFIKEDIPHLFERFYRSEYQSHQGIGIGLSISQEIIQDHHGSIHIYNDQGAVFEILLPQKETKNKYPVTIE